MSLTPASDVPIISASDHVQKLVAMALSTGPTCPVSDGSGDAGGRWSTNRPARDWSSPVQVDILTETGLSLSSDESMKGERRSLGTEGTRRSG